MGNSPDLLFGGTLKDMAEGMLLDSQAKPQVQRLTYIKMHVCAFCLNVYREKNLHWCFFLFLTL